MLVALMLVAFTVTATLRVVVSGATHGNELTGAWVLQRLEHQAAQLALTYPSLQVETLLSNPRAHALNTRFVDADLNRMFSASYLADAEELGCYEVARAKEIDATVGRSSPAQADVLIDLHTTTTNLGCTLIVGTYSSVALAAAAYISQRWAAGESEDAQSLAAAFPVRVLIDPHYSQAECPYLCSIARHGLEVEVGPTPQGLLRADVIAATERAVTLALEYFEQLSSGTAPPAPDSLAGYVDAGKLSWPHAEGDTLPTAIVHPSLQGRDFEPLAVGAPLWMRVDGSVEHYDGALGDDLVAIFINEAAYYSAQSGRGIGLCRPVEWALTDTTEDLSAT